ncbi:hypothetical protein VE03_10638, partial [Pseudogymnoascus sp. 23342-1-I1]
MTFSRTWSATCLDISLGGESEGITFDPLTSELLHFSRSRKLDGDIFQSYLAQAKAISWLYTRELKLSPRLQKWLQDGTQEEREQKRTMVGGSEMLSDKRAKNLNTIEDTPLMKRTGVENFEILSGKEAKRVKTTEDGAAHDFEAIAIKGYGTSGQDTANNMVTAVKIYNAAQGAQLRLSWSQEEEQFVFESEDLSAG